MYTKREGIISHATRGGGGNGTDGIKVEVFRFALGTLQYGMVIGLEAYY